MKQPIFLQPVFQERIWGGTKLKEHFRYNIPFNQTGECWAISAHSNGQSIVSSGKYKGLTLENLWKNHQELFGGHKSNVFPLLTKILDANSDLSVQVHPDDDYANKYENEKIGKTECWYIIDCKEDAEIVFGHNATTKEELINMIHDGKWNELLRRKKIKPGDFLYVPSGTIHALCEGTLVLETQQSSDITYRVYDYDRVDKSGKKRTLHLDKSIEVTTVPHQEKENNISSKKENGATITTLIKTKYFSIYKWEVKEKVAFSQLKKFQLVSVLDGEGKLKTEEGTYAIQKGDHFILPSTLDDFQIEGNVNMIVSQP